MRCQNEMMCPLSLFAGQKLSPHCQWTHPGGPMAGSRAFFSSSCSSLLPFSPVSQGHLLSRNRTSLGHLSNAGELGSHTPVCFPICQIIKFLLASFPLGPVFEGFNYLGFHRDFSVGFLLICHAPPTKEPMFMFHLGGLS